MVELKWEGGGVGELSPRRLGVRVRARTIACAQLRTPILGRQRSQNAVRGKRFTGRAILARPLEGANRRACCTSAVI
jgi:hypothetical protein